MFQHHRRSLVSSGVPAFVALVHRKFLFTGEFANDRFFALGSSVLPTWVRYTGRLNPSTTYYLGQEWLVTVFGPPKQDVGLFPNLFGLLVLILLGTLPLIWGYRRFEQADLS
ncbi:ABC-type copper transport system, permease protein [Haloferax mucosum ATCC BAA-1512]|uniref:ABC-type copper transport system, permease protein n=1 Tax=Haloferax mucosum ATCC BAA-1512 TaxID=662479 RepID=M0IJ17_9EURY|nr:ABC-type copper transport system, permease protein [Haloferax mucosum ATCC BAA-1512]